MSFCQRIIDCGKIDIKMPDYRDRDSCDGEYIACLDGDHSQHPVPREIVCWWQTLVIISFPVFLYNGIVLFDIVLSSLIFLEGDDR